jgi:alpha-amylase
MMEWALPTPARRRYEELQRRLAERGESDAWGPYLSGGTWKGFLAKYDESNRMTRKMMRVSAKVAAASREAERDGEAPGGPVTDPGERPVARGALEESRRDLWRGQCNCAYWHGIFGGLYLPHLRSAVYRHLIRAENLVDAARGRRWDHAEVQDHDLDGADEVLLESHWANVYVTPSKGGAIFEIDARAAEVNLLATMSRYEEAYHGLLSHASDASSGVENIHGAVRAKEKGLERLARPDRTPRRSAVDRFFAPGTCAGGAASEPADAASFAGARYGFGLARENGAVGVVMSASGEVALPGGPRRVTLRKTVWLAPDEAVRVEHEVAGDGPLDAVFASEWNLAFLTGNPEYVFAEEAQGGRRSLSEPFVLGGETELRIVDLLGAQVVSLKAEPAASFRVAPIETASQSEGGFERVFQGVAVLVCRDLARGTSGRLTVSLGFGPVGR